MTKYRFELCEVTHRTGLRLMHPAVALVLQAWGEELIRALERQEQERDPDVR